MSLLVKSGHDDINNDPNAGAMALASATSLIIPLPLVNRAPSEATRRTRPYSAMEGYGFDDRLSVAALAEILGSLTVSRYHGQKLTNPATGVSSDQRQAPS